ncbi:BrnT family toxin [Sphingomonas qomolangmaensis]|uniref:BrnT family toxin n=1 Tax=Sphingomonas qomolangmaensis TaxID=2918765 RepID=UPI003872EE02
MEISFDPGKRDATLRERGLDFADAGSVFDGRVKTLVDDRVDYGETRYVSYGWIEKLPSPSCGPSARVPAA